MKLPSYLVVQGWAATNLVLALILLLGFRPGPLEALVHIASVVLLTGFGLVVLLAMRTGRVGVQSRQPRRSSAAVFAALGLAVGLTGFAYGYWLGLLGLYPLGIAAWVLRGERLERGVRPWPVALDGAEPAGPPRLVYHGSSIGGAVAVPVEHPAHGPPPPPPPRRSSRLRSAVLLVAGARAVADLLRRRRP